MPSTILVNNLCQQRNNNRKKSFMMSEKCDEQNIMMDTINPMVHTDESCNQGYNRKSIDEKSNEDNTSNNHQLMPITNGLHENDEDEQQSDDSTNTEKGHLTVPEIIEVLKNLAACAAKAYERAASLRLDISELNKTGDNKDTIVTETIRYLEAAIENYDAIHKFKHAGTLHYRCSRILKMMNASHEEVDRHHEKALEYFTKPDHELKQRKRIDGLKISCYSSYSTLQRMHHEIEKFHHTTTTTTTTNTIKFHSDGCYRDSDDSDSTHSTTPPPSSTGSTHGTSTPITPAIQFYGEDRHDYHHNSNDFFDSFMADNFFHESERPREASTNSSLTALSPPHSLLHGHNALHKTTFRCIEDRIESARKLVKKLNKLCPFYEVSTNGDDAGRVYCRICDRYLGAVSSTLKNHVNTQEHRQAYEDSHPDPMVNSNSQSNVTMRPFTTNNPSTTTTITTTANQSVVSTPTTSNGTIGSFSNGLIANRVNTTNGDIANGTNFVTNNDGTNKINYANEQQQAQSQQQSMISGIVPDRPFNMMEAQSYQSTIQQMDSKIRLHGKYMDYELNPNVSTNGSSETIQMPGNWVNGNEQTRVIQTTQPYLFNCPPNNLINFVDNTTPVSTLGCTLKPNPTGSVLMQTNLNQPNYVLGPGNGVPGQNVTSVTDSTPITTNMTVLAYQ
ncbi:hypothetical protein RDWZM_009368 [Blomia tropicalis]|uniref:Uncharacterized protein n=1 Tax=Blomia tropicalis TaxID=40697 RepID=A0A9Q0RL01_BLOTA|nr:hypothetical protein RDWZM_009368 [Blomia tropicalis]